MNSAQPPWDEGLRWPVLAQGEVHVWHAALAAAAPEGAERMLCAAERARAARIVSDSRRQRWARSRAVLRELLARYIQVDARTVTFGHTSQGKLVLAGGAACPLFFNLSHTGESALYAISGEYPVGVDIERYGRPRDLVTVARRAFGKRSGERLALLDPELRERAFLRAWVRHEAALKCGGGGIGAAPSGLDHRPWVKDLAPLPHAAGALAVASEPRFVRCWTWTPSACAAG